MGDHVKRVRTTWRRHTVALGVLVVGAALPLLGAFPGGSASGAQPSPSQLLQRSLASADQAGSAHIVVQFFTGKKTGRVVQDATTTSGRQVVVIGRGIASLILVGDTVYFSGNANGLSSYFGLPASLASQLGGRWIAVPSTDSAFPSIAANLALPAALANVTPSGALRTGRRVTVNHRRAASIVGARPGGGGRMTLFVSTAPGSLPVEAVETEKVGKTPQGEIVAFSRWGKPVHVAAPSGAIPISSIKTPGSTPGSTPTSSPTSTSG